MQKKNPTQKYHKWSWFKQSRRDRGTKLWISACLVKMSCWLLQCPLATTHKCSYNKEYSNQEPTFIINSLSYTVSCWVRSVTHTRLLLCLSFTEWQDKYLGGHYIFPHLLRRSFTVLHSAWKILVCRSLCLIRLPFCASYSLSEHTLLG